MVGFFLLFMLVRDLTNDLLCGRNYLIFILLSMLLGVLGGDFNQVLFDWEKQGAVLLMLLLGMLSLLAWIRVTYLIWASMDTLLLGNMVISRSA